MANPAAVTIATIINSFLSGLLQRLINLRESFENWWKYELESATKWEGSISETKEQNKFQKLKKTIKEIADSIMYQE